jgi:hypothetical protein
MVGHPDVRGWAQQLGIATADPRPWPFVKQQSVFTRRWI